MRIGYGWDSHEFKRGVALKLGGVAIPHSRGLSGHSDGDVLLHALTDALLGAVAAGDIGTFFPPSDKRWKGADSVVFVREAMRQVRQHGYVVANVDSTLILAEPKIVPHAASIRARVAELVGIRADAVGVKAKTPEGMGTDNAAIAHVVVLLTKEAGRSKKTKTAVEHVPQTVVDEVVDHVLEEAQEAVPEPKRRRRSVRARS
jgi:2-C-methyl-D-erythritol 2,4-cyclodiphosphate synthase